VQTVEIEKKARLIGIGRGTKEYQLEMEEFVETMNEAIEIMDKYYAKASNPANREIISVEMWVWRYGCGVLEPNN
jgi:hypothetical protein